MSEEKIYCLHGLSGETCQLCEQYRQAKDQLLAQFSDQVTTLNHRIEDAKDQQIQQLQAQLQVVQQEREEWRKEADFDAKLVTELQAERDRLRWAMEMVQGILGPTEPTHQGVCEGCQDEMARALDIVNTALQPPAGG